MPMLPVTMIVVDVIKGFVAVTVRLSDGEHYQTVLMSGADWAMLANTLQPHEWDALSLALRSPGKWVAV